MSLFEKWLAAFKRITLTIIGLICLILGIIGYLVPGLPGTIWLIISAMFFVRASPRLYRFVVNNSVWGYQVRDFLETGSMSKVAKFMSLTSMWIFSTFSVIFAPYGVLFDVPVIVLALIGTVYIVSRPTKA